MAQPLRSVSDTCWVPPQILQPHLGGLGYVLFLFKYNLRTPPITLPSPGLLCYPLRHETVRDETGTHKFVTKNAGELTHFGLSFDDGRWKPVDKFSPIPHPRWTVMNPIHYKASCKRVPTAQQSDAFDTKLWSVQKLILVLALLSSLPHPLSPHS